MIAIIDSGIANLRSVQKGFERVGYEAKVVEDPVALKDARGVVLPGVGAFADGIAKLKEAGFIEPLLQAIEAGKPVLGICLGLHFLFSESEEFGVHRGLDLIKGRVRRFPDQPLAISHQPSAPILKIPHMGWNRIRITRPAPLFEGIPDGSFFYFVHSYYVEPEDEGVVAATTEYGIRFASVIWQENLFATQFHPEKSQALGLKLLENFGRLTAGW
ncbi:MAG: imidazole glycerol phosphate synthase subunit HisH [Candidatus Methylomirabilales bacterium]